MMCGQCDLDWVHICGLVQDMHCALEHGSHGLDSLMDEGRYCYSHQSNRGHGEDSLHQEHLGSNIGDEFCDIQFSLSV